MENKLENNSAKGEEAQRESKGGRSKNNNNHNNKENNKKSGKLKAKQWRNVGLMRGSGFRFLPLGASLFFNSLWSPLSRAAGLPGTLPRFRPCLRPGTLPPPPPPPPPLLRGFQLGLLCISSSTSSSDAKHKRASDC